jgi:succinate-semialdehyde dehydrogenase/glutarate-semialdehyde dehydrogenase
MIDRNRPVCTPCANPAPETAESLDHKLNRAAAAFKSHRQSSFASRAEKLNKLATLLEAEADDCAELMTAEMGKTFASARAEALKCATVCRYYAENGEEMLADEPSKSGYMNSFTRFQPLGTVLAVMPWNFPFWQVLRFAAPALMAGNTAILKHASNVPGCALKIEELFLKAGFPEGVFQTIILKASLVEGLIADPRIAAVTLTGSEGAGVSVGAAAGRAIKKVVLELGGSDPFIIMPSADLKAALSTAVRARMMNNGQSCIAAKRILLHDAIYDASLTELSRTIAALKLGNPFDPSVDVGPLAQPAFAAEIDDQVKRAKEAGAKTPVGGRRSPLGDAYYEPTILIDLPRTSSVACEEFFGPVMLIHRFKTIEEAVEIANETPFGLGSSAWTTDKAEQEFFASNIEAGQVFINAMTASDPRIPFGGTKRSGLGRELGIYGIREFTNVKSICFG